MGPHVKKKGMIIMGKITRQELSSGVISELDKTGDLTQLSTTEKGSLVGAINESVDTLTTHKADIVSQPAPNKIPRALANGKIDTRWLKLLATPADAPINYTNNNSLTTKELSNVLMDSWKSDFGGKVRVKFKLNAVFSTGFAEIYINDTYAQSFNVNAGQTIDCAFDATVNIGDYIKIYAKQSSSNASALTKISNITISFDIKLEL